MGKFSLACFFISDAFFVFFFLRSSTGSAIMGFALLVFAIREAFRGELLNKSIVCKNSIFWLCRRVAHGVL